MKKWITILLSIMLVCALAAVPAWCGSSENDKSSEKSAEAADEKAGKPEPMKAPSTGYELVGQWYCSHDGVPVCLELKDDGAYTLTIAQSETEGTWELVDGDVVLDGKTDAAMVVINSERIMWAEAGEVFKHEEVKVWEPAPAATENIEMSYFDGYWVSTYVESEGQRLPSNVAGDNSELVIDEGRVAMGGSLFGDVICDFTFDDAALSYENSAARVVLQLLEDYTLRCTVTGKEAELIIYMMPGSIEDLPFFISREPEE